MTGKLALAIYRLHVLKPKIWHLQMAEFHQLSVHRWNFCSCIGPKWNISNIFVHLQVAEMCLLSLRQSILIPMADLNA